MAFHLITFTFISQILVCLSTDTYKNMFHDQDLNSPLKVEYYFYNLPEDRLIYARTNIVFCPDTNSSAYALNRCNASIQLNIPLQKTRHTLNRGVWYHFDLQNYDWDDFLKRNLSTILRYSPSANNFLGARVVEGPGMDQSTPVKLAEPHKLVKLSEKAKYVFMFAEFPEAKIINVSQVYTQVQVETMAKFTTHFVQYVEYLYVSFDAYYLSLTPRENLNISTVRVIVYALNDIWRVDLYELKTRVKWLLDHKIPQILFLVCGDFKTRVLSFVPYVEWNFFPGIIPSVPLNRYSLLKYLMDPQAMRIFRVYACDGRPYLEDCIIPKKYPLQTLLLYLHADPRRILLLDFDEPKMIKNVDPLDYKSFASVPFILLPVVKGPNADHEASPVSDVVDPQSKANYVLEFVEADEGRVGYDEADASNLKKVMSHALLLNRDVGIRFSAVHLANTSRWIFKDLLESAKCKWVFVVDSGGDFQPDKDQLYSLKLNLLKFGKRPTYLFLSQKLREDISLDESIVDPDTPPPSFPTTTVPDWTTRKSTTKDHSVAYLTTDIYFNRSPGRKQLGIVCTLLLFLVVWF